MSQPTLQPLNPNLGEVAAKPKRRFRIDDRYIAPMLITCVLLAAQWSYGVLESAAQTAIAILASIGTEMVLGRLVNRKWPHLASAYVTGISIGIIIRSPFFWPYILCSMIAITSKYVIRVRGRHLWNPSNLAISAMLILAHDYVSTLSVQWDNRVWAMAIIWVLGALIIYRLKRFHICATYVVCFIGYAFLRSAITHSPWQSEIAPITGPPYQLFIFFMITDPKTTVQSRQGQMLVAFLVASAECVLRLMGNIHAPYYALTIMGPAANLLEIWKDSRQRAAQKAAPSAPVAAPTEEPTLAAK